MPETEEPYPDAAERRRREELTLLLLEDPANWRLRTVERIQFASSLWPERTRITHILPLGPNLPRGAVSALANAKAWLRLPVTSVRRRPPIGFQLTVAGRTAYRIHRHESADLQARFLARLTRRLIRLAMEREATNINPDALTIDPFLKGLLTAIFQADLDVWHQSKKRFPEDPLTNFLNEQLDEPKWVENEIMRWTGAQSISQVIASDSQYSIDNPAQNPLLSLPALRVMIEEEVRRTNERNRTIFIPDIPTFLSKLEDFLSELAQCASGQKSTDVEIQSLAQRIINLYQHYGEFWIAIADCLVPLKEPFIIEMREMWPIDEREKSMAGMVLTIEHPVTFNDARVNQVSFHVKDPNVEFMEAEFGLLEEKRSIRLNPPPEEVRLNSEALVLASASPHRRDRIRVVVGLRPAPLMRTVQRVVLYTTLATLITVLVFATYRISWVTAPNVALILTPTTFAGSLIIVRESSALSSTLNRRMRLWITCSLATLWATVIFLYLANNSLLKQPTSPHPRPTSVISSST
ncbi:hypothetical protein [Streptomyces sp. NBC_00366]|uniref:hypothetical protein n=1 Tax=Streptomyces sp. NBC_00366 TaxID=2975727 RepID=UPI002E2598A8